MNEHEIFLAAIEIEDPAARDAHLDLACADDAGLRARVDALLAAHDRSDEFLDVPALRQLEAGSTPRDRGDEETSADSADKPSDVDLGFLEPANEPGSLGRLGHYDIRSIIGRGGCGIVLKARDERLERTVAVKVMAPELAATSPARKRFLREAQATAAIRHENVVNIHAVEEKPLPFLVMEYVAGETLQQRIDRSGPFDAREALRLGRQIAAGLEAAHQRGLIHRDIKPSNILLEEGSDRVRITDFGLARSVDDASLTQSGVIAGTPLYMSPEQAQAQEIDHRSDLFSLGSVLYVMCTGRPPFRAATSLAVLRRVAEDQPRPIRQIIPETPAPLVEIISRLHAKDPAERFGSAREAELEMSRRLAELDLPEGAAAADAPEDRHAPAKGGRKQTESVPPPGGDAIARPGKRRWALAAAVVAATVVGMGLADAAGVTSFGGTILRFLSADGVLVVEIDDPSVRVSLDGEELSIKGAGATEIRLRPGKYALQASKDGKPVIQELVTVTRNGRNVVRVGKESAATGAAAPDRRPAFQTAGDWRLEKDEFVQAQPGPSLLLFGDPAWTDYDVVVETKSTGSAPDSQGGELRVRNLDPGNGRIFAIGGYGGTATECTKFLAGKWSREAGLFLRIPHEHGRWYEMKVEVRGPQLRCYVDGRNLFSFRDSDSTRGMIGLSTVNSSVRWRNLRVTDPAGKVLWEGFPKVEPEGKNR